MKVYELRLWRRWMTIALLIASLAACQVPVAPTGIPATPSMAMLTVSPAGPLRATCTPTPHPTAPTVTPAASDTPAPPTVTPPPTLTADERQALARELMQSNGGCELPCWWGIVPGQSDWQGVRDRFKGYGLKGEDYFGFTLMRPDQTYDSRIWIKFVARDGTVEGIQVEGQCLSSVSEYFAQDWQRYSLDNVLGRYGQPSQVLLALLIGAESYGCDLLLLYDHLGIAIRYSGSATIMEYEPLLIRACPKHDEVSPIVLWLQSPQQGTPLLQRALSPDELPYFRSLEEATGMSVETFYETFRDPNSGVCLEGPPTFP